MCLDWPRSSRSRSAWHPMQPHRNQSGSLSPRCGLEASLLVDKTSSGKRTRKCGKIWFRFSNVDICITICCHGLFEAIHLCGTRIWSGYYAAGDSFLSFSVNIEISKYVWHKYILSNLCTFSIDSEAWTQASGWQCAMDTIWSLQFGVLPALSYGKLKHRIQHHLNCY